MLTGALVRAELKSIFGGEHRVAAIDAVGEGVAAYLGRRGAVLGDAVVYWLTVHCNKVAGQVAIRLELTLR